MSSYHPTLITDNPRHPERASYRAQAVNQSNQPIASTVTAYPDCGGSGQLAAWQDGERLCQALEIQAIWQPEETHDEHYQGPYILHICRYISCMYWRTVQLMVRWYKYVCTVSHRKPNSAPMA